MKIVPIAALTYADPQPGTPEEARAKHDKILADLNAPIELGRALKLNYDHKSDRYAAVFMPAEDMTLTLKTTNEIAAFLAEHIAKGGYWLGRMEGGALVDACLIQAD